MIKTEYGSSTIATNILKDTNAVESNCHAIAFKNQGVTQAKIYAGSGKGYKILEAGDSTEYYSENLSVLQKTYFNITFTGGVGDICVEREYLEKNC